MGAVAILMDAVRKKANARSTTFQKKRWILKRRHGGTQIAGVMRKGKVKWRMEYENEHAHIEIKFYLPQ
jgi:hypothetical protein